MRHVTVGDRMMGAQWPVNVAGEGWRRDGGGGEGGE